MGKVEGGVEWNDAELERNLQPDTCTLVGSSYTWNMSMVREED